MSNIDKDFRKELLRTDIVPRKLNEVSLRYKEMFLEDLESGKIKTEKVTQCQCGSKNLEQLTKVDRFGLPFGSLICKDCGLVITSPRICEESLPYYYDKYYHPLNYGKEHLEDQTALFADGQGKKIFNILKEFLPNKEKLKVLEIGAGTGNVLAEFKDEAKLHNINIQELGTEYSNDCITKAKKENNINVIFGNIETIEKRKEKFDVIILSHVFEHFIDLHEELKRLKKLMTEDTLLYIEVPGIMVNHKKSYYNFSFLGYLVHAHMYNFTKDTLVNILQNYGFKNIIANEEVESVFTLDKSSDYVYKNSYKDIINYLQKFYDSYEFLKLAILEKLEKLEIRIQTRDEEIQNLKETVEKQKIRIQTRDEEIQNLKETVEKQKIRIQTRDEEIQNLKETVEKQKIRIQTRDEEIKNLKRCWRKNEEYKS